MQWIFKYSNNKWRSANICKKKKKKKRKPQEWKEKLEITKEQEVGPYTRENVKVSYHVM